jgi:SAM-dependent methyltransferase
MAPAIRVEKPTEIAQTAHGRFVPADREGSPFEDVEGVDLDTRLRDFLRTPAGDAANLLSWPVSVASDSREAFRAERFPPVALGQGPASWLGRVVDEHGLTRLGKRIHGWLLAEKWQGEDLELEDYYRASALGSDAEVLDVGCSSGGLLRSLAERAPLLRVGVDADLEALAFAALSARSEGQAIWFARTRADALPLGSRRFSHVICRNALTYMPQFQALAEIVRVLRPDGWLYLRVEAFRYDMYQIRHASGAAQRLCRLRDLCLGVALAATGLQIRPGSRWGGGRAFATAARLCSWLRRLGCAVVNTRPSSACPTFLGRSTQLAVIAQREG